MPENIPNSPESPQIDSVDVDALNTKYHPLSIEERVQELYNDFPIEKVMTTSSFAANSAYFLHLISTIMPQQKIFFINTGYHFPETLIYKQYLIETYALNVVDVHAEDWKHEFTEKEKTYLTDPDFCCTINKVEPLEEVKKNHQVWVSSLMRWQTEHRASLDIFEIRGGIIKFYPLIDVTKEQRAEYIREHKLPLHPLASRGYTSVGCTHCTIPGDDRSGRWMDTPKTECGLHL